MIVNSSLSGPKFGNVVSRKNWITVGAVVLAMAATLVSQTTRSADRITQQVNAGDVVKVAGTVHPATRSATDLGEVSPGMQMGSLSLNIGLSATQQTEMDALLAAQQNPRSPQYHQWLTQQQYGTRFGLTDADLGKLSGWLREQGFVVKSVSPSRNLITFSGAVTQVESAFRTQIHQYKVADGTTHISNATEISIPRAFSGVVINVRGLNSFRPKPQAVKRLKPDFTSSQSGSHFLAPGDWATIYNVNAIYSAGYTGTGMHVGVAGATYIPLEDITNFRAAAGLGAPLLNMVCISTSVPCTGLSAEGVGDIAEADIDVEWSGGIAKNATVDYIYAAEDDQNLGVFDAMVYGITTYEVGGAVVPVISVSYGDCEYDVSANYGAYKNYIDNYLQQAGTQGQTILIASGDDGAGCTISAADNLATNGASTVWPATSPYVTAVGGTTFDGDGTASNPDLGADAYWIYSATADIISSAIQYIPETSWNDYLYEEGTEPTRATLSSSGGGVSTLYQLPIPGWPSQPVPSGYTGTIMRFVPDIAFAASPDHDGYLVCTQNFPSGETGTPTSNPGSTCVNGFRFSDSTLTIYGGTSVSAQVFNGMLTLLVQAYGQQGNINPMLYGLAANPATSAVFHDITTGNNIVPCATGTTDCVGGEVGYSATTGYDLVTGLGSIDGGALYTAMSPPVSMTAVTVSPASAMLGTSITVTATVSGPNATPTGSVKFTVGSMTLATVALTNGKASWTGLVTAANGFTSGSDTIKATYSGSPLYSASAGSTNLTVGAVTYTFSPSTTAVAIASGGSGTVTLSLTATNYQGTVNFTTNIISSNGTVSAVSASAPSVSFASSTVGTSTLTINTTTSASNHAPAIPVIPWKGGGAIVFAVLLSVPFRLRQKRAWAVLLTALTISALGFMMSCGGGGGSNHLTPTPRTYTITVTPTGTGTVVTNPSAVIITATVQ